MPVWSRPPIQPPLCPISLWALVSFRFPTDRGSTRSTWKAPLVPLRFYWSTKTHPVLPQLCCQFLPQMKSSKASQRQRWHQPLSPLFPRFALFSRFLVLISNWLFRLMLTYVAPPPLPFRYWNQLQQLLWNPPPWQWPSHRSRLQVGINRLPAV